MFPLKEAFDSSQDQSTQVRFWELSVHTRLDAIVDHISDSLIQFAKFTFYIAILFDRFQIDIERPFSIHV